MIRQTIFVLSVSAAAVLLLCGEVVLCYGERCYRYAGLFF